MTIKYNPGRKVGTEYDLTTEDGKQYNQLSKSTVIQLLQQSGKTYRQADAQLSLLKSAECGAQMS